MSERKRVSNEYDCPMCGRITAVEMVEENADGTEVRESVVDYGGCHAAAAATNPNRPSKVEMEVCPIFGDSE